MFSGTPPHTIARAPSALRPMPGTDPTTDLLAALNKALQEGRISPEEYGKRAKVISAAKAQREEDRRASFNPRPPPSLPSPYGPSPPSPC